MLCAAYFFIVVIALHTSQCDTQTLSRTRLFAAYHFIYFIPSPYLSLSHPSYLYFICFDYEEIFIFLVFLRAKARLVRRCVFSFEGRSETVMSSHTHLSSRLTFLCLYSTLPRAVSN
jgi:hypothetical protein